MKFLNALVLLAATALAALHTGEERSASQTPSPASAPTAPPSAVPTHNGQPVSGGQNAITYPLGDKDIKAGEPLTIKWSHNYGDKVTLTLRKGGDQNNLDALVDIAKNVDNSGSFTWTPPKELEGAGDYAIEIVSGDAANYSPKFKIDSNGSGLSTTKSAASNTAKETKTSSKTSSSSAPKKTDDSAEDEDEDDDDKEDSKTESESASSTASAARSTSSAAPDDSDSGVAQVRSPLALVVCVVAAVAYFH